MEFKELVYKLEELELKADIISRTSLAVHDAMTESNSSPESYFLALYGIVDSMFEFDKKLKELVDCAFEIMRKDKRHG